MTTPTRTMTTTDDTTETLNIEIDAAMVGSSWRGDAGDLRRLAEILADETGHNVRAVTSSENGAAGDAWDDDDAWCRALDRLADEHPDAFA